MPNLGNAYDTYTISYPCYTLIIQTIYAKASNIAAFRTKTTKEEMSHFLSTIITFCLIYKGNEYHHNILS
jgi:hypothetical protein